MTIHRHEQRRIVLKESGVRFGIVADTHSFPHPNAYALLAEHEPDFVVHAGDIGSLDCLKPLEEIAELFVVRGNIDTRATHLPDAITIEAVAESGVGPRLRILLTHIAVRGPRLNSAVRKLAAQERADLVVCGHSHLPLIGRDGDVAIFNPGSIGPRRFRLPITFGIADVSPTGVKLRHMDCETGEQWHPVPI